MLHLLSEAAQRIFREAFSFFPDYRESRGWLRIVAPSGGPRTPTRHHPSKPACWTTKDAEANRPSVDVLLRIF
jgi:hypothetical protein